MDGVKAYLAAVAAPDESRLAALAPWLGEGVVVAGPVAPASGREEALAKLAAPNATRMVASATWTEPREEGGEVVADAEFAAGAALAGLRFAFRLGPDGRIERLEQQLLMAPPPAPGPLALSDEMKALIGGALANGTPVIVSYVDAGGVPRISPRGSVQVLNETQLALWARDPHGGLPAGIRLNPNMAFFYRDPAARTSITITGRARPVTDAATREAIYQGQPEIERNFDARRRGVAIVVDVDQVEWSSPAGRVRMARG